MKALLHICCAPCAIYPIKALQEKGMEVFGFFYNPNIHPFTEYRRRLEAVRNYANDINLHMIWRDRYDLELFLRETIFREENRCRFCYHTRLEATIQVAKKGEFDAFTTTLLYSKFQDHELIIDIGKSLAKRYGVSFLYEDFRVGWKEGIEVSKELNMYRQQYCGCIYSEKERFCKPIIGKK